MFPRLIMTTGVLPATECAPTWDGQVARADAMWGASDATMQAPSDRRRVLLHNCFAASLLCTQSAGTPPLIASSNYLGSSQHERVQTVPVDGKLEGRWPHEEALIGNLSDRGDYLPHCCCSEQGQGPGAKQVAISTWRSPRIGQPRRYGHY